jgi:hypothetical protein
MADRLLDRQFRLLEHLTSGAVIFGTDRGALIECAPEGIHGGVLHLEARFSHEKRMAKIEGVLPSTLDLLGVFKAAIVRDFAEACPPVSISRLDNARQFHGFLSARWLKEAPEPPYLPDIAKYELAYAAIRSEKPKLATIENTSGARPGAIRRHPDVMLLRCTYDIRSIIEGRVGEATPVQRDTCLALVLLPGARTPLVSNLSGGLFSLLEMLDQFLDPAIFEDTPDLDELIADLAERRLVEICR